MRIYSQDIGMQLGLETYSMLIMRREKRQMIVGIDLPNQENIRSLREKENYKYLGILEADTIKPAKMKEKIKKE